MSKEKEFIYIGHYVDEQGKYLLKIGTTKDLNRRLKEHNRYYSKASQHKAKTSFEYDWWTKLTKANSLKYEKLNKELYKEKCFGQYVKNDRFCFDKKPKEVMVKIRKTYTIKLGE